MTRVIAPGAALGVLGSGQLGRMFAIAARRMGYRVHTFSPETDTPTGQAADVEVVADYEDLDALRAFARHGVEIARDFAQAPNVRMDKHRVLQILINILRNAKYALDATGREADKRITVGIRPDGDGGPR